MEQQLPVYEEYVCNDTVKLRLYVNLTDVGGTA